MGFNSEVLRNVSSRLKGGERKRRGHPLAGKSSRHRHSHEQKVLLSP